MTAHDTVPTDSERGFDGTDIGSLSPNSRLIAVWKVEGEINKNIGMRGLVFKETARGSCDRESYSQRVACAGRVKTSPKSTKFRAIKL